MPVKEQQCLLRSEHYAGQFFPVADSRIYSGPLPAETCALITPETTLRIPAELYHALAYNVPVGGSIIRDNIFG